MSQGSDRLYNLLPVTYRQRDDAQGNRLRALLRVIGEQVDLIEDDIEQLYDNSFIETCDDWVVPYIGDLIGYTPGTPVLSPAISEPLLIPRREVANTIRYRRRKGALALLEDVALDVAGWPAYAVEYFRRLGLAQPLNHLHRHRGRGVDLRRREVLIRLNGPFDKFSRLVDVRRLGSTHTARFHNVPSVALFVWRLKAYGVTRTPAYCYEQAGPHNYTFSVLGNNTALFNNPSPVAGRPELGLPSPIGRHELEEFPEGAKTGQARASKNFYGPGKSIVIWARHWPDQNAPQPIPADKIIPADLSTWKYHAPRGYVVVDPELGRISFPAAHAPKEGVSVHYYYGFTADIGGGEYDRPIRQPEDATVYGVGKGEKWETIRDALEKWKTDKPRHAVIEIRDGNVYREQLYIELTNEQTLQIRAANRQRPVLRLLDWETDRSDALRVTGTPGTCFVIDGLLVTGRGIRIEGALSRAVIRHCTLVPGWGLHSDCQPRHATEPSLEIYRTPLNDSEEDVTVLGGSVGSVMIDHSIVGAIVVSQDEVMTDPLEIVVSDSIADATNPENGVLTSPGWVVAHAVLTVARCTIIGQIQTHAIKLAENSIFDGTIQVARRQIGCMRFSYVRPESRTPRRFHCQPDLVEDALREDPRWSAFPDDEKNARIAAERLRVRPFFVSVRYGTPEYCQLDTTGPAEIATGAEDESEMGVYKNLFQPRRTAMLKSRIDEFLPAGMEAGIVFIT